MTTEPMYFLGLEYPTIRKYAVEGSSEELAKSDIHVCPQCGSAKIAVSDSVGYLNENGEGGDWEYDCPECHAVVVSGCDYDWDNEIMYRRWLLCEAGTARDMEGYSYETGRDREGYDRNGYDERGYDRDGRNAWGFDKLGYDEAGYDSEGYDRSGHYWEDGSYDPEHDFSDWSDDDLMAEYDF